MIMQENGKCHWEEQISTWGWEEGKENYFSMRPLAHHLSHFISILNWTNESDLVTAYLKSCTGFLVIGGVAPYRNCSCWLLCVLIVNYSGPFSYFGRICYCVWVWKDSMPHLLLWKLKKELHPPNQGIDSGGEAKGHHGCQATCKSTLHGWRGLLPVYAKKQLV